MKILREGFLFLCLMILGLGLGAASPAWKTFKSTMHNFSVRFPASWHMLEGFDGKPAFTDTLCIINFPNSQRLKGVVIKDGGAEIMVGPAPSQIQTIEEWVKEQTKFDVQTGRRDIKDHRKNPSGCKELVEVTSLSEVGPESYQHNTKYYCSTKNGLYGVSLLNWKGDPNQGRLQATALKIALSLRSW